MDRRDFLSLAAAGGGTVFVFALAGCATADSARSRRRQFEISSTRFRANINSLGGVSCVFLMNA